MEKVREKHVASSKGKQWSIHLDNPLPQDLSVAVSVGCFRLLTGDDYLRAHLHRIGIADNPTCTLCGADDMTATHMLNHCGALPQMGKTQFNRRSRIYWTARQMMFNQ